ncbi:DUF3565 domain-containing protein [Agarivorans sp. TSD2052]|uniref:DUF3565 domain-containing protein n=1 Tax=Agarivorans sp. TSD2052 TaxID=2937286 RepID=UPI0020109FB2|nr:DUF3565 domain-containing protein [Agarivorans sp. TSD2052]UPW18803.1 DUF3565 domain-containing protein [Agarivorans sp. TSD2052]
MKRVIVGFQLDSEQHWVARLACGHVQHVRHIPPWQNRPWVATYKGRSSMLGQHLSCTKCLDLAPRDWS